MVVMSPTKNMCPRLDNVCKYLSFGVMQEGKRYKEVCTESESFNTRYQCLGHSMRCMSRAGGCMMNEKRQIHAGA